MLMTSSAVAGEAGGVQWFSSSESSRIESGSSPERANHAPNSSSWPLIFLLFKRRVMDVQSLGELHAILRHVLHIVPSLNGVKASMSGSGAASSRWLLTPQVTGGMQNRNISAMTSEGRRRRIGESLLLIRAFNTWVLLMSCVSFAVSFLTSASTAVSSRRGSSSTTAGSCFGVIKFAWNVAFVKPCCRLHTNMSGPRWW